jgi:hypothetical protein
MYGTSLPAEAPADPDMARVRERATIRAVEIPARACSQLFTAGMSVPFYPVEQAGLTIGSARPE